MDSSTKSSLWLEICRSREDWDEFLEICGREFVHSSLAQRYLPNLEKRKKLIPEYFRYIYDKLYSDERAILSILKTDRGEDGKNLANAKIIIGWIFRCNFTTRPVDTSRMFEIYSKGTEILLKRDQWVVEHIHEPIKKAADNMGLLPLYPGRIAVRSEYKKTKIMTDYTHEAAFLMMKELETRNGSTKRGYLLYWVIIDTLSGARKLMSSWGLTEVAHLHYDFKPGLKCCENPTVKEEKDVSCHFVFVQRSMASSLRSYFQQRSSL
uniref:uncharacterized protein LOC120334263 n=1 Tax=Styela clava TaxID=7725 RepID=UPI00193ACA58|nr:uncharacterized protein LOC120334263 [Styela clava]